MHTYSNLNMMLNILLPRVYPWVTSYHPDDAEFTPGLEVSKTPFFVNPGVT